MRRRLALVLTLALAAVAALALSACGTSSEQEAKNKVCTARDKVLASVMEMQNITTNPATKPAAMKPLLADVNTELKTMTTHRSDLAEPLRGQTDAAVTQFKKDLGIVANGYLQGIGKNSKNAAARAQALLTSFATGIGQGYQDTLARIACG